LRDVELLRRAGERNAVSVNMTIVTPRVGLARSLEPRAPRPDLRFDAVKKLREAGIAAGVFAMPVIAGVTDRDEDLDLLARNARDAGAAWFTGGGLRLMPSAAREFFPWAQKNLSARIYERLWAMYGNAPYGPPEFAREIAAKFEVLRKKYGLSSQVGRMARKIAPAQFCLPLGQATDLRRSA
jgi:DNA repair photolyase